MWSFIDTFTHKWLKVPYQLHVSFYGNKTHPPIVFLHGIAVDSGDWQEFIKIFQDRYYCITIDLLGFGKSPKPQWATYTMKEHLRSLLFTLRKMNVPQKYILVGHSLGSLLATRIAIREENHVAHLLLLSPPVYPPIDQIKPLAARKLTGILLMAYKFLRSEKMTPKLFAKISRILPFPQNVIRDPETWIPAVRTLKNCIEEQTILSDINKIKIQSDVYYGSYDQVVIGYNVRQLASNPLITIHKFIGDHFLTKAYAKVVNRDIEEYKKSKVCKIRR